MYPGLTSNSWRFSCLSSLVLGLQVASWALAGTGPPIKWPLVPGKDDLAAEDSLAVPRAVKVLPGHSIDD